MNRPSWYCKLHFFSNSITHNDARHSAASLYSMHTFNTRHNRILQSRLLYYYYYTPFCYILFADVMINTFLLLFTCYGRYRTDNDFRFTISGYIFLEKSYHIILLHKYIVIKSRFLKTIENNFIPRLKVRFSRTHLTPRKSNFYWSNIPEDFC